MTGREESKFLEKYAVIIACTIVVLILVIVTAVISAYVYMRHASPLGDSDAFGTFGDYIGGTLNPIFGFFTFLALLVTIVMQRETISLQRKELNASTREMAKSAKALDQQVKAIVSQNFEGLFFRMIQKQTELLEKMAIGEASALTVLNRELSSIKFKMTSQEIPQSTAYLTYYSENNSKLGPYFRNLYHTLRLLDENQNLNDQAKYRYANIFRAQLSSLEISLIFYNCQTELGAGLKPLIEKYRFLKHIERKQLPGNAEDTFSPEAYRARD